MMKKRHRLLEKPWCLRLALAGLIAGVLFISSHVGNSDRSLLCYLAGERGSRRSELSETPIQLTAILHYATSRRVPQQSVAEITVSFDVLQSLSSSSSSNFLIFGLGFDSLMWSSLNAHGETLFLEEDPKWVQTVLKDAPTLRANTVRYRTHLSEAYDLLTAYRSVPECMPPKAYLRGNDRCKLALSDLPDEVYDKEWDLIMIDAPRGYFPEAPGRMAAIFSAAVMARARVRPGVTHVFLHDVDRRVEKVYAEEFLCPKYRVNAVGRLWHFEIPSAANLSRGSPSTGFC